MFVEVWVIQILPWMEELCCNLGGNTGSSPCPFFTTKLLLLSHPAACRQINEVQIAFRWSY